MKSIKNLTMVIVDTINHAGAIHAINKSLEQITPERVIFFTNIEFGGVKFRNEFPVEVVIIERITSKEEYSKFIIYELINHIKTTHCLIIQHDGFVLNGSLWHDSWMEYDYIGAPWLYTDGRNVGNGGFSLRSFKLMEHTAGLSGLLGFGLASDGLDILGPEDEMIGRLFRGALEGHGCKFPTEEVASKFSFELQMPLGPTFGFHGIFHEPYKPIVVIVRDGAMGDVVMLEPVLRYFHENGYRVVLDTHIAFFDLYKNHYYPVYSVEDFPELARMNPIVYNLNMAYEILADTPNKYVHSYFEMCCIGIDNDSSPALYFNPDAKSMFPEGYVVVHWPKRQEERTPEVAVLIRHLVLNYFGQKVILLNGYDSDLEKYIPKSNITVFHAENTQMLMYLIAKANAFVGVDSGPAHIAGALGVKSDVFFCSTDPERINHYASWNPKRNNRCDKLCWHIQGGTEGQKCQLKGDEYLKCTKFKTL